MVEAGALGISAFAGTVDFYVVYFAIVIHGNDIEACAATVEVLCGALGNNFFDHDVIAVKENAK